MPWLKPVSCDWVRGICDRSSDLRYGLVIYLLIGTLLRLRDMALLSTTGLMVQTL